MLCMSGLGAKQQLHTSHGSNSSKQSPKNNTFQGRKKSQDNLDLEINIQ